ncbi:MAG: family efflux transporter [Herbinix sp.]|jgi:putative MATE family efflux protein|nr:family efflux transporter [Herbinix sp.]
MARTKDMTYGKPGRLMFGFALPLMFGNVFQQMYTIVDTFVVGQVLGVEALAALGASEWFNWLVLGTIVGFTQGFSIIIAQRFGADDKEGLRRSVTMSTLLAVLFALGMLIFSQALARPMLIFLNTPENIVDLAIIYMRVTYAGVPVIMAYNTLSAILRALGDSKTPLYAMIIASFVNVVLDTLFVVVFHWGIAGAAYATVIAQLISCVFCYSVVRKISILKLRKEDWKPQFRMLKNILLLGAPTAFQNTIIAIGGLVVQYVINGFGFIYVAGFTATNKLYGLLEIAASSYGYSASTFAGQNLGAKKYHRIKEGIRAGCIMAVVTSAVISFIMLIFGRLIVALFISGEPSEVEAVIVVAHRYLNTMAVLLFVLYLLHLYRSALQGMGDTITPMISGIVELIMRISIILILPKLIGEWGLYFAEVAAWTGAEVLLMVMYYYRIHHLLKSE